MAFHVKTKSEPGLRLPGLAYFNILNPALAAPGSEGGLLGKPPPVQLLSEMEWTQKEDHVNV